MHDAAQHEGAPAPFVSLADKVHALRSPLAYADPPGRVQAIETHFAWVFLTDVCAYKLKKPLLTAHLDLSTLAAREVDCLEEVRLNRRLAPDVYLHVAPLTWEGPETLRVDGRGAVVDWLVVMRRLPSALMLDRAMLAHTVSGEALERVGRLLARFYASQERIEMSAGQYLARIERQIDLDRAALGAGELRIDAALVQALIDEQRAALRRMGSELAQRVHERRIVEAHGDLRPEHVCLSDPPCVIDCLEFSVDLRTLDPGEELAYFWIECAYAGAAWVGERVLNAYRSAACDFISPRLMDFYCSRRATVRGKVVAWHLLDPTVAGLAPWKQHAEAYLRLARERLSRE